MIAPYPKLDMALQNMCRDHCAERSEVGLSELQRIAGQKDLPTCGQRISNAMRRIDWLRDGWLHAGYDRTPRYVRRHQT